MAEPFQVNESLLGTAMNDAAKVAAERELRRQILEQRGGATGSVFVDLSVDCHLELRAVKLDGEPLELV